jgi:hypothetical protein
MLLQQVFLIVSKLTDESRSVSESWLNDLLLGGELDYLRHFRLSKATVEWMTNELYPVDPGKAQSVGRPLLSAKVKVHVFLKRVASRCTVEEIARMFAISHGSVIKSSNEVCERIITKFHYFIR